jgi:hypothetical protein
MKNSQVIVFNKEKFADSCSENKNTILLMQKTYIVLQELARNLREKQNKIENIILKNHEFFRKNSENFLEKIENFENSYEIQENQKDLFYELLNQALIDAKLSHPRHSEGYNVACISESNVIKYQNKIFNFVCDILIKDSMDKTVIQTFKSHKYKSVPKIVELFMKLDFNK